MDKKKEIIKGVKTLVLKKGYNNVSVEDITTYIGIAKGSFYTYFKSKNSLINYILEEKIMRLKREMNNFFKNIENIDQAVEKLVKLKLVLKNEEDIKVDLMITSFFRNIDSLDEHTVKILIDIEKITVNFVKKILLTYQKDTKIQIEDIEFYSKFVNSIINNYKIFNLFVSDKNDFIRTIHELDKKYRNKEFKSDMEKIIQSIIKILK
ncbi:MULTISPECIES: TetR/AcrR family transcriptional regulator [Fusobacterium]|jgi:AcrR family transcriptional regulator|uniref:TetR/AcrR family transcriptional regulator n=1 Tax=Fusobacterium hominis TaxID=2764326 RepID=A0A7G9GZB7_9FUSO|nr:MULTISPECIES: TetR/AcrR family transcriptional regulator [Fusobacterium]QNM16149.1 TetR/AcrR family transcriptional regulator [Fusobacterium hominis]